eukprot:4530886-Pleurochrysis_carterae.AAC.1
MTALEVDSLSIRSEACASRTSSGSIAAAGAGVSAGGVVSAGVSAGGVLSAGVSAGAGVVGGADVRRS